MRRLRHQIRAALLATAIAYVFVVGSQAQPLDDQVAMNVFLDRLMLAESGGRDFAKNPLSTALGPYQFISSTFLDIMRRHFPTEHAGKTPLQILSLRTDRVIARKAAEIYTRENAQHLRNAGQPVTFANLRLAFLVGASGASRVLQAPAEARAVAVLGPAVAKANPFMYGHTTASLIARSAREAGEAGPVAALSIAPAIGGAAAPDTAGTATPIRAAQVAPALKIRCNMELPSCRKWVALHSKPKATRIAVLRRKG
jgi:hypothetical protein